MVLPANFLKLSLGLNPPQHLGSDEKGALFRADNAGAYARHVQGIPSYATNINRLHYTVKRARSIIEGRDASVPVPQSELSGILTKLEDLESQVKALFQKTGATAPTLPVPGPAPASQAPSGKTYGPGGGAGGGAGDQDCDAENLIYDMGARAVVDADGQVTGHPLFRRNANCPMRSAVHGKHASNTGGPGDSSKGSARGGDAAAAAAAANKEDTAVLETPATRARAGFPQVVPATVETVEIKTLPINGEFVASTVTRTTTLLSTVVVVPDYKATGVAEKAASHIAAHTMKKPKQSHSEHVHRHKTKVAPHVPAAPSPSSFSQFSNDTSRFSNSTTVGHIAHVEDGQKTANVTASKSFNHTSVDKTETSPPKQVNKQPVQESQKAANTTAPPDSVSVAHEPPANGNTTTDKAASTPSSPMANLTETAGSGDKMPDTKADDKSVDSTSHQETNSAPDTGPAKEEIRVITVVPIPAQPASAPPAKATAAVAPGIVAAKPESAASGGRRANETWARAQAGFKTVRVPGSK